MKSLKQVRAAARRNLEYLYALFSLGEKRFFDPFFELLLKRLLKGGDSDTIYH